MFNEKKEVARLVKLHEVLVEKDAAKKAAIEKIAKASGLTVKEIKALLA
jgi:hypothetical protein